MANNKLCCRIFPLILILISVLIAAAIWYFNHKVDPFSFLHNWRQLVNFAGSVLFVAVLPIGLFYWLVDQAKFESKAKLWTLLGFIPALGFLVFLML